MENTTCRFSEIAEQEEKDLEGNKHTTRAFITAAVLPTLLTIAAINQN
jgi:hypothetical protein